MKRIILFAVLACGGFAYADEGYLLNVDFTFKKGARSAQVKSEIIIPDDNSNYISLGSGPSGVALLAKIAPDSSGLVMIDYMIVDTQMDPAGLQGLHIRTALDGSPSAITSGTDTDFVTVKQTVTHTEYTVRSDD